MINNCQEEIQKMKFFKSRALAITVIVLTVVMLIVMTVLSLRLYVNLDLIRTPRMLLEGEYSSHRQSLPHHHL